MGTMGHHGGHVDASPGRARGTGRRGGADRRRGRADRGHRLHLDRLPGRRAAGFGRLHAVGRGPDAGPIVPADSTLRWHSCAGLIAQLGIHDCTMLSVPLNYADPGGRHISLALDMVPATAPPSQQQGILLVNPGGPGASGLSLAAEVADGLTRSVAGDYDIVGFDPRGVGSSVPQLSCDPGFFAGPRPNYIPASAAAEQVLISAGENVRR